MLNTVEPQNCNIIDILNHKCLSDSPISGAAIFNNPGFTSIHKDEITISCIVDYYLCFNSVLIVAFLPDSVSLPERMNLKSQVLSVIVIGIVDVGLFLPDTRLKIVPRAVVVS
jgi:hypothetical protein